MTPSPFRPLLAMAGVPLAAGAVLLACAVSLSLGGGVGPAVNPAPVLLVFGAVVAVVALFLPQHGPRARFGWANHVTLARGVLAAWLAGLIGTGPVEGGLGWAVAGLALVALALDGVDGWLARSRRTASPFGARFDMETDALMLLVLSILVWEAGRAGPWVLAIGLMRYGFVAAGWLLPALRAPLPASLRRKAVCVVQGVALAVGFVPILGDGTAAGLAAVALALLGYSFAVDSAYLLARKPLTLGSP